MSRRRLGPVTGRCPGNRLLVQLAEVPPLGTQVRSERGEPVGTLVDVIGPVASPLGVVRLQRPTRAHELWMG